MNNRGKNNQSISQKADQLIRNYQIQVRSGKEEVLDTLFKKIEEKEKAKRKSKQKITWYLAGAASVAATVAVLVTFWFFTASQTISADKNTTFAYRLPDHSRVVLHDGSSLSFNKYFWNKKVELVGEGYFEVEKGNGFQVETKQGEVEVLGTRFLVNEGEDNLRVQCFQGSVKTNYENDSWVLEPGTQFTGKNKTARTEEFETEAGYPGFAQFNKNFSNTPLSAVVNEIENFFGVDIEVDEPADKNFSGTVQTGNLENMLQIVCEPLQLEYRFESEYKIRIF